MARTGRSGKKTVTVIEDPLLASHPRRPVISKTPGSFRRLALYHIASGVLAISCQLAGEKRHQTVFEKIMSLKRTFLI